MHTSDPRTGPFSALAKPTGAACNLACTYCFFLSKDLLYDQERQSMSEADLETYLRRVLAAHPDGEVVLGWQGGEPTLRGLDFFRRAVLLAQELSRPAQRVRHTLQTNGTLIDDEWGTFLAENEFLVGISIDGPAHLHDGYRVNRAGRGTHAQVVRGWEVLRRHGVEANVLCTVHANNADHPLEVYRHLRDDLGARFVQFIPIVERVPADLLAVAEGGWRDDGGERLLYLQRGDAVTSRSVRPLAWGRFLSDVFGEWVTRDVGTVFVQTFDVMLGNLFGMYTLCVHAPECGRAPAVEFNGDVYSCDHYVEPDYLLGNFSDSALGPMLDSDAQRAFGRAKQVSLPAACRECSVRWACHGGCPKDRFGTTADGESGLNYLCEGYQAFFNHATPATAAMASLLRHGRPAADIMAQDGALHRPPEADSR